MTGDKSKSEVYVTFDIMIDIFFYLNEKILQIIKILNLAVRELRTQVYLTKHCSQFKNLTRVQYYQIRSIIVRRYLLSKNTSAEVRYQTD